MRILRRLGWVFLLGALGAAPPPVPTLKEVADDLERVEKAYWDYAKRMDALMKELGEIRRAFPTSSKQEELLRRREALRLEISGSGAEENLIRSNIRDRLKMLQVFQTARLLTLPKEKYGKTIPLAGTLVVHEQIASEIGSHHNRLWDDFAKEDRDFIELAGGYKTRQATRRFNAIAAWAALGAAALGGAAFLLLRAKKAVLAPTLLPGPEQVGNFELRGLIGRGAMGEVFEGVEQTLGRRAALKRLREDLVARPADLERLLAEARVVASLKHPNIVAIHSVERVGSQVYLAFEFVDGETLERVLQQSHHLDRHEALRILRGVCSGLQYAHAHRIVHRDLKPANIMLTRSGTVKVMDFGIAYEARQAAARQTRAAAWGTPPYMAPEQELGSVSGAVDLFALSVSYYQMLTGELPFKGPNFLAQKREGLFTPASALVPGLPRGMDGFFSKALAPEASKRFPSAEALAAAAEA